jgi:TPP-dependent 2-oxoacid decarboxylase
MPCRKTDGPCHRVAPPAYKEASFDGPSAQIAVQESGVEATPIGEFRGWNAAPQTITHLSDVAGDGGFMMVCQELSSLAIQKSNAVIFVLSNRAYAIEQAFVSLDAFKPDGKFAAYDLLPTWDYLALAQAFGAKGFRATTVSDLTGILPELKNLTGQPALIEVVIPQKDLAPQLERLARLPASLQKYNRTNILFSKK